jgi:hypothetical protein
METRSDKEREKRSGLWILALAAVAIIAAALIG